MLGTGRGDNASNLYSRARDAKIYPAPVEYPIDAQGAPLKLDVSPGGQLVFARATVPFFATKWIVCAWYYFRYYSVDSV